MEGGIEMQSRSETQGDVEALSNPDPPLPDPMTALRPRLRLQNRGFAVALTLCLIGLSVYLVGGFYENEESTLVDPYDANSGFITNDFDNAKTQEAFEQGQLGNDNKGGNSAGFWKSHGKDNPYSDKLNGGSSGNLHDQLHRPNHTSAQNAAQARWNRTHPGETFPGHGVHPGGQGRGDICERKVTKDFKKWLRSAVTKKDGVKYEIVKQLEHDKKAFTQGLTFAGGQLWESTGLYGESTVRILDPETADVINSVDMDGVLFGEGMTYYDKNKLIQITWKSRRGFIYDATNLTKLQEFSYTTTRNEGWGITLDECRNELIVSDGSDQLHYWDPVTLAQKRRVAVKRQSGKAARSINEIEFWRGRVLANVWHEDVLLVINPVTGVVEKEYDFSTLWPSSQRRSAGADVFNGISVSADPDILYVTGRILATISHLTLWQGIVDVGKDLLWGMSFWIPFYKRRKGVIRFENLMTNKCPSVLVGGCIGNDNTMFVARTIGS